MRLSVRREAAFLGFAVAAGIAVLVPLADIGFALDARLWRPGGGGGGPVGAGAPGGGAAGARRLDRLDAVAGVGDRGL